MQALISTWKSEVETHQPDNSTIHSIIEALDNGDIRVAEQRGGQWIVHEWIKSAIVRYFGIMNIKEYTCGILGFRDKIPVKSDFSKVRVVPGGSSVRFGVHLEEQVVLMPPCYVNIGARIGAGTMVDSNVLVGSCAQIGKQVHLSAGVQIGGVLEPVNARPVIIEDHVFVGAGAIIVEGILVRENAIIAPGVVLSAGTKILEVNKEGHIVKNHNSIIPKDAIVVPGARKRGEVMLQSPIIIGYRNEKTDAKVALSHFLREF